MSQRVVRASRGAVRTCKTWHAEAALRMLMNNLDPEVAEDPASLIVYGGRGQAARDWASFDAIVRELVALSPDETLLVQSGKPVGVLRTHEHAPRVPAYIRPEFCRGRGPFRWVALSGEPEDIFTIDRALLELFPEDEALGRWLKLARERVAFQGLPARICWLGLGQREKAGLRPRARSSSWSATRSAARATVSAGWSGQPAPERPF